VKLKILYQGRFVGKWSLAGEHFFVGEAKNSHFQLSPSVDADAQVLLRCGFVRKLFAADQAIVFSENCSFFRSESNQREKL